jgi:hypothetical protein
MSKVSALRTGEIRKATFLLLLAAAVFVISSLAACATEARTTMVGPARAVINPAAVRVYEQPPKHFQEIALMEGRSITELRNKAAAVGANGLLIGVAQNRGPVIGLGVGNSSYSYGRHGAVGIETGASFAIPTGGSVLQATAIHVP